MGLKKPLPVLLAFAFTLKLWCHHRGQSMVLSYCFNRLKTEKWEVAIHGVAVARSPKDDQKYDNTMD